MTETALAKKETIKYAFTVTLKPQCFKKDARAQFEGTADAIEEILCGLGYNVTCVAELTKNYNIHFHGIITFTKFSFYVNYQKLFVDKFRNNKVFGFVNIKQMEDESGWIEYISKDFQTTFKSIYKEPIIVDTLGIFDRNLYKFQF